MTAFRSLDSPPAVPAVIDHLFQCRSLDSWLVTSQFSMDSDWKDVIGQQGINEIADRFRDFLKGPVTVHQSDNRIMMCPSTSLELTTSKIDHTVDKKTRKIPRPPNAFILYRKHQHPIIKEQNPGYHNNEISKVIGAQWHGERDEVKSYFNKLAQFVKEKHAEAFPDYSYHPRKTAEKKRRMTPKKLAKLHSLAQAMCSNVDEPKENSLITADNSTKIATTHETTPTVVHHEFSPVAQAAEDEEVMNMQNPLPQMQYGHWDDSAILFPEFTNGDPAITPEVAHVMFETHNQQQGSFGSITQVSSDGMEVVAAFDDMFPMTNQVDWDPVRQRVKAFKKDSAAQYGDLFIDANDTTTGLQESLNTQSRLPDTAAELSRQDDLLGTFLSQI